MRNQINNWIKEERYKECFDLISKSMTHRQNVEWAIFSAELALPFYSGKSTKPEEAIEAAKRCLRENFSPESVRVAHDAAEVSYDPSGAINAAAARSARSAANTTTTTYFIYAARASYEAASFSYYAVINRKESALKIIEKGLDILTPTSVMFMREIV